MLEKFSLEAAAQFLPAIFRREITLKEGIHHTLGSIQAVHYAEIIEFISHQPTRPGLKEFLEFLNYAEVPFIVISDGLIDMIKAVLAVLERQQLLGNVRAIYAGEVDATGSLLRPYSQIASDTEFVAKARAMNLYSAEEKIAIGDSVTDINMALAADLVFARDRLRQYLDTEDKPYLLWQNFFDIKDRLATRWQVS